MHVNDPMILTIQTTQGLKSSEVGVIFTNEHPFGAKYRGISTCTLPLQEIIAFWNAVDLVLSQHSLTSNDFIRTINATDGNITVGGEMPPNI